MKFKNFLNVHQKELRESSPICIIVKNCPLLLIKSLRKNFSKVKGEIFNLGLSTANLTKLQLAQKIKKQVLELKIKIVHNKKDPDQRDYFVSNRKIEKLGFRAKVNIDDGIAELVNIFRYSKTKIKNNY